jgi:glycine/D-amino acid oxidase-like deaminating enzyme
VTVVELRQVERLDPIFARADLALAAREVEVTGDEVKGVVHNIGAAEAPEVVVAVTDAAGRVLARESLGALAAPLNLAPKRRQFTLRLPAPPGAGWKLVVDPERRIAEIYEGNNEVPLGPPGHTMGATPW